MKSSVRSFRVVEEGTDAKFNPVVTELGAREVALVLATVNDELLLLLESRVGWTMRNNVIRVE